MPSRPHEGVWGLGRFVGFGVKNHPKKIGMCLGVLGRGINDVSGWF